MWLPSSKSMRRSRPSLRDTREPCLCVITVCVLLRVRIAACPHRRHRPAPHTAIEGVGGLLHHSPSTVEGLRERHASLGIVTQLCHPAPPAAHGAHRARGQPPHAERIGDDSHTVRTQRLQEPVSVVIRGRERRAAVVDVCRYIDCHVC